MWWFIISLMLICVSPVTKYVSPVTFSVVTGLTVTGLT